MIHGPHQHGCPDGAFCCSAPVQSIQLSRLVASLPALLSMCPRSTPLPSDRESLLPACSPGLFLHPTGLSKAGRVSGQGLAGKGAMKVQVGGGDNTSPLSQLLALSLEAQSQLWNWSRRPIGSSSSAVMVQSWCFLEGAFLFPSWLTVLCIGTHSNRP